MTVSYVSFSLRWWLSVYVFASSSACPSSHVTHLSVSMTASLKSHLIKSTLEVERKFSRLRVDRLTIDGGQPPFSSLHYLGHRTFHDVYYDQHGKLAAAGTWLRQRDGRWQSKIRQAGDYINSQFREIEDIEDIRRHVHSITHISAPPEHTFGLSPMAQLTTHRSTWQADGRFKIVLDRTDFGHVVGEVELEAQVLVHRAEDARHQCRVMDGELQRFMQRYSWAFDSSPAVGKLTAYFAQQRK